MIQETEPSPPPSGPGAWGERVAERGYRVLARNWWCSSGEIDLIVGRGGLVVISEVKTRSSIAFGWPAEAVDHRRQARLRSAAAVWLRSTGTRSTEVRSDVVLVLPERLEGAFGAVTPVGWSRLLLGEGAF
jgi:putative endonuclease